MSFLTRIFGDLDALLVFAVLIFIIYILGITMNVLGIICLNKEKLSNISNNNPQRVILTNLSVVEISIALLQMWLQYYYLTHIHMKLPSILEGIIPLYSLSFSLVVLGPFIHMSTGWNYEQLISEAQIKGVVLMIWVGFTLLTFGYASNIVTNRLVVICAECVFLVGLIGWLLQCCKEGPIIPIITAKENEKRSDVTVRTVRRTNTLVYISLLFCVLFFFFYWTFQGSIFVAYFYSLFMSLNIFVHPVIYVFASHERKQIFTDMVYAVLMHKPSMKC